MLAEPPFCLLKNLSEVDDAIDCNAEIADDILLCGLQAFGLSRDPDIGQPEIWQGCASAEDVDLAHSTIRQLYRDWSAEGGREREACYDFILGQLRAFSSKQATPIEQASRPKLLVPGAGLGRLVFELCRAAYDVEGNEISYHQLLASSWILNHAGATPHALYPFVTQFTNLRSRQQQLRKVMIPDIHPAEGMKQASAAGEEFGKMDMTAGDFVVLYSGEECIAKFDAIVTMFFIDTAPNLIRYIDTVRNCLRPKGVWINVGPLLWHSDDAHNAKADGANHHHHHHQDDKASVGDSDRDACIGEMGGFQLTEEEVIWLLEMKGFQIEHREVASEGVGYIQDADSMFQNLYRVSRWVATKTD
jgi:carnosine N-methyltransferase